MFRVVDSSEVEGLGLEIGPVIVKFSPDYRVWRSGIVYSIWHRGVFVRKRDGSRRVWARLDKVQGILDREFGGK